MKSMNWIKLTTPSSTEQLSPAQYALRFKDKEEIALKQALDIRKFEIELYWKRAQYFWTFIGAVLAGFFAVQASSSESKIDLSVILACLGTVFSFAWFCVNRGSKFWQENWEKHVDLLEDTVQGPLYKIVLSRNTAQTSDYVRNLLTGPSPISVSKINQLISFYVFLLWVILLAHSLPEFNLVRKIDWFYVTLITLSAFSCILFWHWGKSYEGGYYHIAKIRKSRINPKSKP